MYLRRRVSDWWVEPSLVRKRVYVPKRLLDTDPATSPSKTPLRGITRGVGHFQHSRKWVRYNRLQHIEVGYITPLYDLRAIATRYGLSQNSTIYFRKHILPDPFDVVRRRSVQAHHWSRFTLMVLDTVLLDLQSRGYNYFLKSFEEHVDLVQTGVSYLQDYYGDKFEAQQNELSDRHGVQWL